MGDLTPWIHTTLHTVADWQREYDALRVAGREVDKLPSEMVVGCFRVGLLKLKADVEVACRRLHDALTDVLQDKVGGGVCRVFWLCICSVYVKTLYLQHSCHSPSTPATAQALEQKRQVAQFLEAAQSLVAQQASSVEGIGRARRDAKELINQLPGILGIR